MACIQVASFWFVVFGLGESLGCKALVGVGFFGVGIVWLEKCTLGRSGGSGLVVVAGWRWRGWRWVVALRYMVR